MQKQLAGQRKSNTNMKYPGRPPSFIPPGRSKTASHASPADVSSPSPSHKPSPASPQTGSDSAAPTLTADSQLQPSPQDATTQDSIESASEPTRTLSEERGGADEIQTSGNLSRHSSTTSLSSLEACERLEHIVVAEAGIQPEVMPVIQVSQCLECMRRQ